MKKIGSSILSSLLLTSVLSNIGFADPSKNATLWDRDLITKPTLTLWGLGGNQLIGTGQGLIPLESVSATSIIFGAAEAAGSSKQSNGYSTGIAVGYRNLVRDSFILGGYIFADYNRSPSSHYFWVANPGIEALGNIWDLRVNGYFPTNRKHWLGKEELAENVGITKFEKAFGHDRYDHFVQCYEEVGPGLDAEVGREIHLAKSHNPKIYLGGYHYFMDKTDQISGIEGRIVYPINKHFSLEARDSYDKVRKNVFMGGIRISFGGYDNDEKDTIGIVGRLSDPIEHDFGNFASATSIAVGKAYIDKGGDYHLPGAFWYFDNSTINKNSTGDGTFEHPFNAIDLRAYQLMTNSGIYSQNVQMYFDTGISTYDLSGLPGNRLSLLNGYSIYGRTSNFTLAASAFQRPILNGGITAFGNNNLSDIVLQSHNNGFGPSGALFLDGTKSNNPISVNINDVNINVSENKTEATGIGILNSYVTINNSQVNVNSTDQSKQSFGIALADNSALFLENNNYIHATISSTAPGENHAAGIIGISPIIVSGNNNNIIADATGSESRAIGIFDFGNPIIISGNYNHIIANANGFDSRSGGIVNVGTTIISGNHNQIISNASGIEGKALGIGNIEAFNFGYATVANDNSQVIISGNYNQIAANSEETDSIGILNTGTLIISGNKNQIIANTANHIPGHECNAGSIVNFGNALTISGYYNQLIANSAGAAYGIIDLSSTSSAMSVRNTIFNVATTASTGGKAAGISMEMLSDASKIIVQNNVFNIAATGINANAYGIFLPNTTTPASIGNIAGNIFNVTNFRTPQNAWGIYANSKWSGSTTAWFRKHNIWINPTSAAPQQQVYTDGIIATPNSAFTS